MLDQNEVFLSGIIKDVPSIKVVGKKNSSVANFTVLQTSQYNYEGELHSRQNYHRCVAWGALAELIGAAAVGQRVEVRGELTHRSYEQDNQKKYITEVKAQNVFLPQPVDQQASSTEQAAPQPVSQPMPDPNMNDEIPF